MDFRTEKDCCVHPASTLTWCLKALRCPHRPVPMVLNLCLGPLGTCPLGKLPTVSLALVFPTLGCDLAALSPLSSLPLKPGFFSTLTLPVEEPTLFQGKNGQRFPTSAPRSAVEALLVSPLIPNRSGWGRGKTQEEFKSRRKFSL